MSLEIEALQATTLQDCGAFADPLVTPVAAMAHASLINEKQAARNTGFMHLRLYLLYFSQHMPIKSFT
jgi:hypothetical protein